MIHYLLYITHPKELAEVIEFAQSGMNDETRIVCVCDGGDEELSRRVKAADRSNLDIVVLGVPLGMGVAISTGMNKVLEDAAPEDLIITCHSAHIADKKFNDLVTKAAEEGFEVVVASRYHQDSDYRNFPAARKYFSRKVNDLVRDKFFYKGLHDYTVFLRAYRVELIRKAFEIYGKFGLVQSRGYVANTELLVKLSFISDRIVEAPFTFDFNKLITRSRIGMIRTINEYMVLIGYLKRIRGKLERKALLL